jgi:LemA protein
MERLAMEVTMGWVIGIVLLGLVLLLAGFVLINYNALVRARNAYTKSFAQIDVQLTRRHDLIPNLVETAKGYLAHERQTLEAVVAARSAAVSAQSSARGDGRSASSRAGGGSAEAIGALAGAENLLTQALGQLFALAEGYPTLKANQNMLDLQEELTTTENRIAFARQAYNDAVLEYNTRRQVFPASMIAGSFGFGPATLFELDDPQQRGTPQVSF